MKIVPSPKQKKSCISKKDIVLSEILEEKLFLDISSLSTSTFGGKKHWFLVIEGSINCEWSYFLKEKLELKM